MSTERIPVSAVIATYNRAGSCRAAVESVLAQRAQPLEVLVCDDASPREVADELRHWCESQPDVTFVGLTENNGPATARNAGVERARGEWIAFLDDDDRWLPGKLEAQWEPARHGVWDVVAANAVRSTGGPFYDKLPPREPTSADLHTANPVILSTALARRASVLAAGGFPEARRYIGLEDYALWLRMADRGARFLVLESSLVEYADEPRDRLSSAHIRRQLWTAELFTRRWLRSPLQPPRARAAARESVKAARFVVGRALGR